ncbi:hypothetical protein GWI33_007291 [Rhynchophorus ferrugineus]|uniref:Uncharacterized protein n=1 Tax=Rhynchophorus ferrugineus TaxID=354439 RepID=A0A834MGS5_RHYFE|nr:hypothetical protein GWI33_007291 [Rhynchophorus ferrugineus]
MVNENRFRNAAPEFSRPTNLQASTRPVSVGENGRDFPHFSAPINAQLCKSSYECARSGAGAINHPLDNKIVAKSLRDRPQPHHHHLRRFGSLSPGEFLLPYKLFR